MDEGRAMGSCIGTYGGVCGSDLVSVIYTARRQTRNPLGSVDATQVDISWMGM